MKDNWNPNQYEKFKDQRAKPFYDLMGLVEKRKIKNAIDLGCGTGELTRKLFDELKPDSMTGIDSSSEMLAKSKTFETSGFHFEKADIKTYQPSNPLDLIFSNAALQWLPNHETLFPRILSWASSQGQVAIQMPCNFDHPSHVIANKTAYEMFPSIFANENPRTVLSLERYAEILFAAGFQKQIARIEVYGHPMSSGRDVVEWTKGTLLTMYKSKLSPDEYQQFEKAYANNLVSQIGEGPYFYAFKRMLLWGQKTD